MSENGDTLNLSNLNLKLKNVNFLLKTSNKNVNALNYEASISSEKPIYCICNCRI